MAICFGIVFKRSFRATAPISTVTAADARFPCLRAYRESSSRYQLRLRRATRAELEGAPGGELLAVARSIEGTAQLGPARLVEARTAFQSHGLRRAPSIARFVALSSRADRNLADDAI